MSQNAEDIAANGLHYFDFHRDSEYEAVRHQYRRLVQQCHPDRHDHEARATAHTQFIEINAAFKLLRRHYHQFGYLPAPENFQIYAGKPTTRITEPGQMARNDPSYRVPGHRGKANHHKKRQSSSKRRSSHKQAHQSAESKNMKTALLLLMGVALLIGVVLATVLVPIRG
jgi:curved DNA-binding protein CbpA